MRDSVLQRGLNGRSCVRAPPLKHLDLAVAKIFRPSHHVERGFSAYQRIEPHLQVAAAHEGFAPAQSEVARKRDHVEEALINAGGALEQRFNLFVRLGAARALAHTIWQAKLTVAATFLKVIPHHCKNNADARKDVFEMSGRHSCSDAPCCVHVYHPGLDVRERTGKCFEFARETQKRRDEMTAVFLMFQAAAQQAVRLCNLVYGIGQHGHMNLLVVAAGC
jgi:hypothetical protein